MKRDSLTFLQPKGIIQILILFFLFYPNKKCYSQNNADSLISLTENHTEDTALVSLYINISKAYQKSRDSLNAVNWGNKSIDLSRKLNYRKGEASGYEQLGFIHASLGELKESVKFHAISLEIRLNLNDKRGISSSYLNISGCKLNSNKYDSAIVYAQNSIDFGWQAGDTQLIVKAMNIKAGGMYRTSRYKEGIEIWLAELKLAELINDSLSVANVLGNIGTSYSELGYREEAIKFQRLSYQKKFHNNQRKELVTSCINLARSFQVTNQLDSAMYYINLGIPLGKELKLHNNTALLYANLSAVMIKKGEFDSALVCTQLAHDELTIISDTMGLAQNFIFMGDAYAFKGEKNHMPKLYSDAERCYTKALEFSKAMNSPDWIAKSYGKLADVYAETKKYDKAYDYLEKYVILNDSISNTSFSEQIAEMQTKYETEKKQNEINLLNSEKNLAEIKLQRRQTGIYSISAIAILILASFSIVVRNVQKKRKAEKQVAILERQNAIETMRSKIASDVHDDMGSNLTRIGLYSEQLMLRKEFQGKEKELVEKISQQSKDVITGMKEIIWASNPAHDNLKSMLGFMRQYIERFFDGMDIRPVINFPHDIGEIHLHPEVRRNLFLILKESLNNAVKYSGTDKIDIDFKKEDDSFKFNIRDYGKGMKDGSKDDFSNGIHNMQRRAEQIRSVFRLITSPGKGVEILVEGKLY